MSTEDVRLGYARDRAHVLVAILKAQDNWEATLARIAAATDDVSAKQAVADELALDEGQATAVLDMQFRRMSQHNRARLAEELAGEQAEIERLTAVE